MYCESVKKWLAFCQQFAVYSYSVVSRLFLWKLGPFLCYKFYITRLSFMEEWRRKHILFCWNFCANLLVSYECNKTEADHANELHKKGSNLWSPTKKVLNALQVSRKLRLKIIVDTRFWELHCTSTKQTQVFWHFRLLSYVANIPEC